MRTLFALLTIGLAGAFALAQTPDMIDAVQKKLQTLRYLQSLQQADGGYLVAEQDPNLDQVPLSSLRATSSSLRAIKAQGGKPANMEKSAAFVKNCFDKESGSFSDRPGGKGDVATTAVGLMAIAELQLPMEEYAPKAVAYLLKNANNFEEIRIAAAGLEAAKKLPPEIEAWQKQIRKLRNDDGTFGKGEGKARYTGGGTALLSRLGVELNADERKAALIAMNEGQFMDGGFRKEDAGGSDLETCYRVMRAFHMLKEKPKAADKLAAFIGKCRNEDGGYSVTPGQKSSASGTYYAATVLKWLNEK